TADPHVELDAVGARSRGELERGHRVLRRGAADAAVAEDERRSAVGTAKARDVHRPTSITEFMPAPPPSAADAAHAKRAATAALLVSALGYFVDIYDLILFGIVRMKSLRAIGVPESKLLDEGIYLLNWQMGGMFIGGILWGVLGDKR